jgi:hypothetical protein
METMLVFPALALVHLTAFGLPGVLPATASQLLPPAGGCAAISALPAIPAAPTILAAAATAPTPAPPPNSTLLDYFDGTTAASTVDRREWGDSIHNDPGNLHRIYYQNVDGIRNTDDTKKLYASSMAQLKVGTFCWADHSLNLSQVPVKQSLTRAITAFFGMARTACSFSVLPPGPTALQSGYQPGGTLTTTTGKWATRSTGSPIVDPSGLGRWSGLRYQGKQNKKLAIVTAYRSPRQSPTGGYGFYDQQYALLLSQGVKKPQVRKQFILDLTVDINKLQADGFEVILSLDANETMGEDRVHGISSLAENCTLQDLHCLGAATPPETYPIGTKRRIDFMFGSAGVIPFVRKAGYLEYNNGILSMHRGMFIDLDFEALMGPIAAIVHPAARGIRSEDQASVDKYIISFKAYADDHKIWSRVAALVLQAPFLSPVHLQANYDAIDRDVTRAMLHAEKQARRPSGQYAWSPKLREVGLLARYWHLRLNAVEKQINFPFTMARLLQKFKTLNIVFDARITCTDAAEFKTEWKAAVKLLRTVCEKAYDHRAVHLQATLAYYTNLQFADNETGSDENKVKIHRIHTLINTEKMRQPFRGIHSLLTPLHGGGISKLFVPSGVKNPTVAARYCSPDGSVNRSQLIKMAQADKHSVEYDTLIDSNEIEAELLRYNHAWFRQAAETPFGHGDLFDLVGYSGLTEAADAIVDGACPAHLGEPMSREVQAFLEECRRPANVKTVDTVISTKAYVNAIKAWKETTSTSPSGRHLGHYRTAILDKDMVQLHTDLLNLPIAFGFAPER